MPALQRAVTGRDDDDVAGRVGEALGLDVPRLIEVLLDEAFAAAERGDRLARGRLEHLGHLFAGAGDLQASSAAAERRLDGDRQADLVDEGEHLRRIEDRVERAGRERRSDLLRDVAGAHLVTEPLDRVGRRADPDQPGILNGPGERGVLGQEAVSGVHGIRAGAPRDGQQLLDDQVRVGARRAVQRVGLVGELDVPGIAVLIGVDGDGADARIPRGADDSHGDLAPVRDEDLRDPEGPDRRGVVAGHSPSAYGVARARPLSGSYRTGCEGL
jgi:hypothetical protein